MFKSLRFTLILFLCMPFYAQALTYEQCFKKASKRYGVPYNKLLAIAFTESSFKPTARNSRLNRNGSVDYGFMQINTLWAKEAGRRGFKWRDVVNNPCTNVMFGAWILNQNYRRLGSWSSAIGAYNAGFSKSAKARATRHRYYSKVMRNQSKAVAYSHRLRKKTTASKSYSKITGHKSKAKRKKKANVVKSQPTSVASNQTAITLHEVSEHYVVDVENLPEGKVVSTLEGVVFEPVILKEGEEAPVYIIGE